MTVDQVRALLMDQAPHLAMLHIRRVASGWDNAVFRLGDAYAVRSPVRAAAAPLVANEQRWPPLVGAHLDVPLPLPFVKGVAGQWYPWSWSVVPWLEGETVATVSVVERHDIARDLGDPHPLNLLTDGRHLTGLIDFGDIGAGDPASDLATAWLSFDEDGRAQFRDAYAASGHLDDALWTRGRGWAAALALAFLTVGGPDGALHDVARHAVRQLA